MSEASSAGKTEILNPDITDGRPLSSDAGWLKYKRSILL